MGIVQIEGSTTVDLLLGDGVSCGPDVISPISQKRKRCDDLENHMSEQKETLDNIKFHIEPEQAKVNDILLNSISNEGIQNMRKNIPISAFPRAFTGRSSVAISRRVNPTNHSARSRTWHRTDNHSVFMAPEKENSNPAPLVKLSPRKFGKIQGLTYIRKGHTLVRKPSLGTTLSKDPLTTVVESRKPSTLESKDDGTDSESFFILSGQDRHIERPKTPRLQTSTYMSDCAAGNMAEMTVLTLENPSADSCSETTSDSVVYTQNGADLANNGSKTVINETEKTRYVKRKANQLVAATNESDLSLKDVDRHQAKSTEGCYKRRRTNQIVRTMTNSQTQIDEEVPMSIPSRSSSKKQSASRKMYSFSNFSPVQKLSNIQSSSISNRKMVWPKIFPWKRATYLTSCMQKSNHVLVDSSVSTIRKLVLSRKRNSLYTRSNHGFSLHISKLLSVDGSSLKGSKSNECNTGKANEEATIADATLEKTKRDRNNVARKSVDSVKPCPGARIYRIGAVRYKMDPTKRTLLRIIDEKKSPSLSLQSDEKKPYVPRRLVIGNDEYVQVGNGNRLIRDPKKRTKTLASEKVRWSLHTARLCLAQKKNYCQFFTRFGTCIKYDDGKCSYIHDRSKVAVCTKFLNHSCSNPNCKLTHEVIPDRMEDCSYFLQGICSNVKCPYRHVNVNTNASLCEGFLKGYCSTGNECRKKHTYSCPIFEETGQCSKGSECKLHHPKLRKSTKKMEQKNGRGRYFAEDTRTIGFENHVLRGNMYLKKEKDTSFQEEKLADYIALDASDDDEGIGLRIEETSPAHIVDNVKITSSLDIRMVCHEELIKPIRLLSRVSESSNCFY